MVCNDKNGKI